MLLFGKFENMFGQHLIFLGIFSKIQIMEKEVELNICNIPFNLMPCERVYSPLIIEYKPSKTLKHHFCRVNNALEYFLSRLALKQRIIF
jgi:hypothetical protein